MHKTTIYLPEELKHAMARLAQARGISEAELMREALQALTKSATPPRPRLPLFKSGLPGLADNVEDALEGFGQS
jgi:Arc/MetJ-type ribon-helix-helix transcriptional regulator